MFKSLFGPVLKQYIIVITASISIAFVGMDMSWPSPVLVKLRDDNQTVLPQPITDDQGAWIVSISGLPGFAVIFVSGFLMDHFGRKNSILLICVPRIIKCLLYTFASDLWMILLGRGIAGFVNVFTISVIPTYASEIASKEIRGSMGIVTQMLSAFGALIMLSIGPFVPYVTLNVIMVSTITVFSIPLLFIPESPYFLHSKGRTDESIQLLTSLRGSELLAQEEIKDYSVNNKTTVNKFELLKDRTTLKTIAIVVLLTSGFVMTGFNAIFFYLQTIFESTQTNISSEISSIIIGCIQLLACLFILVLADRFRRKTILTISLLGMTLGMAGLGLFFQLTEDRDEIIGFLNIMPLISIILVIFCYNAGIGSMFLMLVAELFDGPARAFGVSISAFTSCVFWFLLTNFFPTVTNSVGPAITYWMFGGFCLLTWLVILFCVPDTKGKTFTEIQRALGRPESELKAQTVDEKKIKV